MKKIIHDRYLNVGIARQIAEIEMDLCGHATLAT